MCVCVGRHQVKLDRAHLFDESQCRFWRRRRRTTGQTNFHRPTHVRASQIVKLCKKSTWLEEAYRHSYLSKGTVAPVPGNRPVQRDEASPASDIADVCEVSMPRSLLGWASE